MNDGFVGFNLGQAVRDLEVFRAEADRVVSDISNAVQTFSDAIIHNWASPKAVDFENQYDYKLIDLFAKPKQLLDLIVQDAAAAISELASANSVAFDFTKYVALPITMFYSNPTFGVKYEQSPSGQVGMNIEQIERAATEFNSAIVRALSEMKTLPSSIAIYDNTGQLHGAFITRIAQANTIASDTLTSIMNSIVSAIGTETNQIITGTKTAIEQLFQ